MKRISILLLVAAGCGTDLAGRPETSIEPGLYVGTRDCDVLLNGQETSTSDTIQLAINENGLPILSGQEVHEGLENNFDTGASSARNTVLHLTVLGDGLTIDWDTTLTISGVELDGFVQETYRRQGSHEFEFFSRLTVGTETTQGTIAYSEECRAIMMR